MKSYLPMLVFLLITSCDAACARDGGYEPGEYRRPHYPTRVIIRQGESSEDRMWRKKEEASEKHNDWIEDRQRSIREGVKHEND